MERENASEMHQTNCWTSCCVGFAATTGFGGVRLGACLVGSSPHRWGELKKKYNFITGRNDENESMRLE